MIRPLELAIALRYLRSRSRNGFVSFISAMSVGGIALAVAVLITVSSAMNGFEHEVRERILGVLAHGSITGVDGPIEDWRELERIARAHPDTRSVAPFVGSQAMVVGPDDVRGVEVRGIDPAAELATADIGPLIRAGDFTSLVPGAFRIVVGQELADRLGLHLGDDVVLLAPEGVATPAGVLPRMRHFRVSGIFYAGMYEYDRGLVFVDIADAARLFRTGDGVTGLRLSFRDPAAAPAAVRQIGRDYGGGVFVTDWTREHVNFFRSIQLTKSIMFVILLLVIAVAAFNIVSTLVMVVREKRAEVAILRTLGAPPHGILAVFVGQGALIGVAGTALGVALGVLLSLNLATLVHVVERMLGIRFLAPDVYFISDFPTQLLWSDVLTIGGVALLLAVSATVYPALRAAVLPPAEALRHG